MDYEKEKLKQEYEALKSLWNKLVKEWKRPSDFEDLYRVYPFLTTTGAIVRKYSKKSEPVVNIIKPALGNVDTSEYLYSDEDTFFNGVKSTLPLSQVASMFLHGREYVYMDNRKKGGDVGGDARIYLFVKTDVLCESCSLANNGIFNPNKRNHKKTVAFITYTDCTCGYYIEIDSYLKAVKNIIDK